MGTLTSGMGGEVGLLLGLSVTGCFVGNGVGSTVGYDSVNKEIINELYTR